MKKKSKLQIFIMLLSLCFALTVFSFEKNYLVQSSASTTATVSENSIFIKKPTFATYYNNKIYFIDEESTTSKHLKIYDITYCSFETVLLDLSSYSEIKDAMALGESLFLIVSKDDSSMIVKIDLENLIVSEITDSNISDNHSKLHVSTSIIDGVNYYTISLTPNTETSTSPSIIFVSCDDLSVYRSINIQFDTQDELINKINNSLIKMFVMQASTADRFYLILFAESNVYYSDILASKTEQSTVDIVNTTPFKGSLENTNTNVKISNINLIDVENKPHFAITYYEEESTISITQFYSYNIGDSTDTEITKKHYTEVARNNYILTNYNFLIYSDDQQLVCKTINYDSTTDKYSTTKQEIKNPEISVNYFSVENFIYKTVIKETSLLSNPWSTEPIVTIPVNTDIIHIGTAQLHRVRTTINDYIFCMYTVDNVNYTGYVTASNEYVENKTEIALEDYKHKQIITVCDGTNLYSLPTKVVDSSLITDAIKPEIIDKISKETKLEIIDTICEYTANNTTFVRVKINETIGYIDCKDIVEPSTEVEFIITNSCIQKNGTKVYTEASTNSQVKDVLSVNKMVRIDGARDTKTGLTHITYNDEYGNVLSGYIVTDYVETDSWSVMQIIGCVLIAINIGLLILVLVFKSKHIGKDGQKYQNSKKANYRE